MSIRLKTITGACLMLLVALAQPARAELTIEIVDGVEGALPIAVVPFAWQGRGPGPKEDVAAIIRSDLHRSGQFDTIALDQMIERPHRRSEINFGTWRLLETDYLVIGRIQPDGRGYRVEFELYNTHTQRRLLGYAISAGPGEMRALAHHISDMIYEELLGVPGAFSSRIAYVTANREDGEMVYRLKIADSDGYNAHTIVRSHEPLMSPVWSPNGKKIAYVSFESGNSAIYIQTLATGARRQVTGFKGINGAPAFSPDGETMAVALSKGGNLDIYLIDLDTGEMRQLTDHWAIDTEPRFMPDGERIVFTSDRGGQPQLYMMPVSGGDPRRITFEGEYNAAASISPDGSMIAMVHSAGDGYTIAVKNRKTGVLRVLTDGPLDEAPSFAPNGSMILYATEYGRHGVLAAVSTDGRVRQRLRVSEADVREPAWSP